MSMSTSMSTSMSAYWRPDVYWGPDVFESVWVGHRIITMWLVGKRKGLNRDLRMELLRYVYQLMCVELLEKKRMLVHLLQGEPGSSKKYVALSLAVMIAKKSWISTHFDSLRRLSNEGDSK